jgi:hypothetical protein
MISKDSLASPPRLAAWLVGLFTSAQEAESIPADLQEEFSHLALKSGIAVARRWYWRQALRTIAHLSGSAFLGAPWLTTAVVVGGFLLNRLVYWIPGTLLSVVTDRYLLYWSNHFKTYMFMATDGMMIAHFTASLFVGCVVALAARGREMLATMTLGFIRCVLGVAGLLVWLAMDHGDNVAFLWVPALQVVDAVAMAIGGVMVRRRRMAAKSSAGISSRPMATS